MNKKDFKISLIIPAFNEEKYIGQCLDSVVKNSNGSFFEIIVVDNRSTDNTNVIASRYPNVKVVHEDKKGLTRARQRGYVESKGEILAYIDADTIMPEGWYEKVIKEFNSNENLACLSGPGYFYDVSKVDQWLLKNIYWRIVTMITYYLVGYMTLGANFAIKKDVVDKMGGFDTSIEFYGEDTNIARRAHQFGKVKFKMDFFIYTSGRRARDQGFYKTGFIYMVNFISEALAHKPITNKYKDFR